MTESGRVVCIYHSDDLDGCCSGAIVRYAYSALVTRTILGFGQAAELVGWDYGEPVPWEKILPADEVWVVDLCLPPDAMLRIRSQAHLIWCDHHKTALEWADEVAFCPDGARNTQLAGCELTWAWACPGLEDVPPLAVTLLGRYDVWDHSDERVLPFQAAVRLLSPGAHDDLFWYHLFSPQSGPTLVDELVERGRAILEIRDADDAIRARAMAYECEFAGLHCIAANLKPANARTFASVADPERHDMLVSWGWQHGRYVVNLYQVQGHEDIDCSAIAKARGGGGHPGAAGFTCSVLPPELLDPDPDQTQRR